MTLERTMESAGSLKQHLLSLEERLLQPQTRKDATELASLLSDDFVEFGSSGAVFDKTSIISALSRETPTERSIIDFKASPLAEGIVLVTYRAIRRAGAAEAPVETLHSSIWKRVNGEWKMAFHQGTLATKGKSAL